MFGKPVGQTLLNKHLEKTVMFADENKLNADVIKDKKSMYRNHRLSRDDKKVLYKLRPDLNLKSTGTDDDSSSLSEQDSQSTSGSLSYHSVQQLGSVMFAVSTDSPQRTNEEGPSGMKYRAGTPRAPRTQDAGLEWDVEEKGDDATEPFLPTYNRVPTGISSEQLVWLCLLILFASDVGIGSAGSGNAADYENNDSSSSDEADEEDETLIKVIIADQTKSDER